MVSVGMEPDFRFLEKKKKIKKKTKIIKN